MNIDKLRALSGAVNAAEHVSGILGSPIAALATTVSIPELGDALNYAADEIERLRAPLPAARTETLDLRIDPEAQETIRKASETIETLTEALRDAHAADGDDDPLDLRAEVGELVRDVIGCDQS